MRLVYNGPGRNGQEVQVGDITETFRGEPVRVTGIEKPHSPASTGLIHVNFLDEHGNGTTQTGSYYPGVIDADWIEREDRD